MFSFGDAPPAGVAVEAVVEAPEAAQPAPPAPPASQPSGGRASATVAAASATTHSKAELEALKVTDLKKLAAEAGLKGASKLKKADLVEALLSGQ